MVSGLVSRNQSPMSIEASQTGILVRYESNGEAEFGLMALFHTLTSRPLIHVPFILVGVEVKTSRHGP